MNQLFEPITFKNKPLIWNYHTKSDSPFAGFYHWHQCAEFLLIHKGAGTIVVNHQTYEIKKGMLFLFHPFELHKVHIQITSELNYERSVIHFDPVIIENYLHSFPFRQKLFMELMTSPFSHRAFDLGENIQLVNEYFHYYENSNKKRRGSTQEEITYFMLQLITEIQAIYDEKPKTIFTHHRPTRYSETIMQWLDTHYTEEFNLDRLANFLHLSKFYVSRVFRQETGSCISEYLTARRIKQACHLLETTTLPVNQIGENVGLNNTSHFVHLFKKVVGTTPLRYRNSQ